jgi:hypothetical protein
MHSCVPLLLGAPSFCLACPCFFQLPHSASGQYCPH